MSAEDAELQRALAMSMQQSADSPASTVEQQQPDAEEGDEGWGADLKEEVTAWGVVSEAAADAPDVGQTEKQQSQARSSKFEGACLDGSSAPPWLRGNAGRGYSLKPDAPPVKDSGPAAPAKPSATPAPVVKTPPCAPEPAHLSGNQVSCKRPLVQSTN